MRLHYSSPIFLLKRLRPTEVNFPETSQLVGAKSRLQAMFFNQNALLESDALC